MKVLIPSVFGLMSCLLFMKFDSLTLFMTIVWILLLLTVLAMESIETRIDMMEEKIYALETYIIMNGELKKNPQEALNDSAGPNTKLIQMAKYCNCNCK